MEKGDEGREATAPAAASGTLADSESHRAIKAVAAVPATADSDSDATYASTVVNGEHEDCGGAMATSRKERALTDDGVEKGGKS